MPPSPAPFSEELETATRLAQEAAAEILRVRQRARTSAQEKADDQGPVTEADLAADALISAGLRSAFPRDRVVTEETWKVGEDIGSAGRIWFVDPLDGTQDFIAGTADYAVMIGLVVDGKAVMGVVAQPETGLVWRAVNHEPAFCERIEPDGGRVPVSISKAPLNEDVPRATISRSHPSRMVTFLAEHLGITTVVKGSVGLKIALIIDGGAEMYLSASTRIKVWDTAAPQALIEAAGGEMEGLRGEEVRYDGAAAHASGIRAWTPAARKKIVDRIPNALQAWRAHQSR